MNRIEDNIFYCIENIKGFTPGKGYNLSNNLYKMYLTDTVTDLIKASGVNSYINKRNKSNKKGKPVFDLVDDNGNIRPLNENQIKRSFTLLHSEVDVIIRDKKLNKLLK
jgi:hypothetical protein